MSRARSHWRPDYNNRMRKPTIALLSAILLAVTLIGAGPSAPPPAIDVYFSPKGGCTEAIVKEIGQAKRELKLQAYSFTSSPIAQAIAQAQDRGVKVTVMLDDSQRTEKYTGATYLQNHQVPVLIDAKHAIAHNKIILIDGATVITGSFNFTKAAEESNAENLLVIRDPRLAEKYLANFAEHLKHAEAYAKK